MHLINLMVNYLYRKYGVPSYIFLFETQVSIRADCQLNGLATRHTGQGDGTGWC